MKKVKSLTVAFASLLVLVGCQPDTKKEEKKTADSTTSTVQETVKEEYEWNDHLYEVEAVSGATVEEKQSNDATEMDKVEKDEKMYWSGRPEVGTISGDYYHNEVVFNEGYTAVVDVVVNNDEIALVEFDEIGPGDYYEGDWAGTSKRLSGYAFFQASKGRTDKTLVTIVNTMTYLENQMISENRLDGTFKTVKGSSNSANEGFIPAVNELAEKIKEESTQEYHSITQDFGEGLFGRLIVITDKKTKKMMDVRYDEYFADSKEDISDEKLQDYYRQSKYESKDYSAQSGEDFRKQTDDLVKEIIAENSLEVNVSKLTFSENFSELATEMTKLLAK